MVYTRFSPSPAPAPATAPDHTMPTPAPTPSTPPAGTLSPNGGINDTIINNTPYSTLNDTSPPVTSLPSPLPETKWHTRPKGAALALFLSGESTNTNSGRSDSGHSNSGRSSGGGSSASSAAGRSSILEVTSPILSAYDPVTGNTEFAEEVVESVEGGVLQFAYGEMGIEIRSDGFASARARASANSSENFSEKSNANSVKKNAKTVPKRKRADLDLAQLDEWLGIGYRDGFGNVVWTGRVEWPVSELRSSLRRERRRDREVERVRREREGSVRRSKRLSGRDTPEGSV